MYATLSADVVSSTSLSKEAMIELNERLKKYLSTLELRYQGFWGRIVKGDSIECVMDCPEHEHGELVIAGELFDILIAIVFLCEIIEIVTIKEI